MSLLPKVPTDLQGKTAEYLVELVRQLERELRNRPREQSDGVVYIGHENPYTLVDEAGNQYRLGEDVIPPGLGDSDLQANGGSIPETDRTNTFTPTQVFSAAPAATGHPLRFDELAANGGSIPETDQSNTFASVQEFTAMPTVGGDVVVESGSNANGSWVKWADGTQICYHSRAGASNPQSWTYPAAFVSAPVLSGNVESNAARLISFSERSATAVNVYAWVSDTGAESVLDEFLMAIGRWK